MTFFSKLLTFTMFIANVSGYINIPSSDISLPSSEPTPSATCVPKKYFLDADRDGFIDTVDAQWYGWYNSDSPTSTGDYEHIGYINGRYSYSFSSLLSFILFSLFTIETL
jgi:hypothetical protein